MTKFILIESTNWVEFDTVREARRAYRAAGPICHESTNFSTCRQQSTLAWCCEQFEQGGQVHELFRLSPATQGRCRNKYRQINFSIILFSCLLRHFARKNSFKRSAR